MTVATPPPITLVSIKSTPTAWAATIKIESLLIEARDIFPEPLPNVLDHSAMAAVFALAIAIPQADGPIVLDTVCPGTVVIINSAFGSKPNKKRLAKLSTVRQAALIMISNMLAQNQAGPILAQLVDSTGKPIKLQKD